MVLCLTRAWHSGGCSAEALHSPSLHVTPPRALAAPKRKKISVLRAVRIQITTSEFEYLWNLNQIIKNFGYELGVHKGSNHEKKFFIKNLV
jgi:hypothetical protein